MKTSTIARAWALGCVTLGVLALAGTAAAGPPRLALAWEHLPYSGETVTRVGIGPDQNGVICLQWYAGQSTGTAAKVRDTLEGEGPPKTGCVHEDDDTTASHYSTTLGFTKVTFGWNGLAKTAGSALIERPGPCVYRFAGLVADEGAPFPEVISETGSATGYLIRRASLLRCELLITVPWFVNALYPIPSKGAYGYLEGELFG